MLKDLTNFTKKPVQNKAEQLMSMGGGMLMLRKGVTRPGIIGAVSLAIGATPTSISMPAWLPGQGRLSTSPKPQARPPCRRPR